MHVCSAAGEGEHLLSVAHIYCLFYTGSYTGVLWCPRCLCSDGSDFSPLFLFHNAVLSNCSNRYRHLCHQSISSTTIMRQEVSCSRAHRLIHNICDALLKRGRAECHAESFLVQSGHACMPHAFASNSSKTLKTAKHNIQQQQKHN